MDVPEVSGENGWTASQTTRYTEVTSDLYYSGGHLGTLKIPGLGLSVKVYEGTGSAQLAKGAGHFTDTSIINFSEADKTASVYTHNEALKAQLSRLCADYPKQVRQTADNGCGGMTFELPKKWLKIKPPRVLSPAQQEVVERMNRKRWGSGL